MNEGMLCVQIVSKPISASMTCYYYYPEMRVKSAIIFESHWNNWKGK